VSVRLCGVCLSGCVVCICQAVWCVPVRLCGVCVRLCGVCLLHRSIMAASRGLGRLDQRVSDAVKARRELDLRIGKGTLGLSTHVI